MTHSAYALFLASFVTMAAVATFDVSAQADEPLLSPRSSPMPLDPTGPRVAPAPEWSVWRTFYDSLEFYSRESPEAVESLFAQRAALTSAETTAVLEAGRDYLLRLSVIDEDARTAISRRFSSSDSLPMPLSEMRRAAQPRRAPEGLRPKETPSGLTRYEILAAEGVVARVEERRQEALQGHKEQLSRVIHPAKVASIEHWIGRDVAPSVKVVTHATLLPAPLPDRSSRP